MKNLLLKITIVLILAIVICTGYVQAAVTSGYRFGITADRTDSSGKYVYTFQPSTQGSNLRYIWNVQQYNNGIADSSKVFYCLAEGYGDFGDFTAQAIPNQVPTSKGGISSSSYSGPYRLKDAGVVDTLRAIYNGKSVTAFDEDKINGLVWILDNMYIPKEAKEDSKETFLSNIKLVDENGTTQEQSVWEKMKETQSTDDDITDFDIEVAQQLAIWKITNASEQANGFPTIYLSVNGGTLKTYDMNFTGIAPNIDVSYGRLRNLYVKSLYNYFISGANKAQTDKRDITEDSITTISVYANASAQPVVTITREEQITGKYDVILKKVDDKGNILPGAVFTVNGQDYTVGEDGLVKIATDVEITEENRGTPDTYTIVEKEAPAGYSKYEGTITATITKKEAEDGLSYIVDNAILDNASNSSKKVSIDKTTNTITITVVDTEITGKYDVMLKKVDTNGKILPGAVFTVNDKDYITGEDGLVKIATSVDITEENVGTPDTYTIIEKTPPSGYIKYNGTIILTVTKKQSETGSNYMINEAILDNASNATDKVSLDKTTNTITITVIDEPEIRDEYIDLALRKFISKVVTYNDRI